jgi:hypothetical protein
VKRSSVKGDHLTYPTSWKPTTKTSTRKSEGVQRKRNNAIQQTFLSQKINTAHGLLDLQTLLHLARLYIPEPDRLIVTPTDKALAPQKEGRAEVGVSVEEPDGLWEAVMEVGFAMMEGSIERFPIWR